MSSKGSRLNYLLINLELRHELNIFNVYFAVLAFTSTSFSRISFEGLVGLVLELGTMAPPPPFATGSLQSQMLGSSGGYYLINNFINLRDITPRPPPLPITLLDSSKALYALENFDNMLGLQKTPTPSPPPRLGTKCQLVEVPI